MGLTRRSTGPGIHRTDALSQAPLVALAGNPNVGKSTLFNALTGLHQHTGNWTGKTVSHAVGLCKAGEETLQIADIPGTYSLSSHSPEETVARDFIAFEHPQTIAVVCDSTCLERSLTLALQIMEMSSCVVLCLNLTDEARRRGMEIRPEVLSAALGVPVVQTSSKDKKSILRLRQALGRSYHTPTSPVSYPAAVEEELRYLTEQLDGVNPTALPSRFLAIKLLEQDEDFLAALKQKTGFQLSPAYGENSLRLLAMKGFDPSSLPKLLLTRKYAYAETLCRQAVAGAAQEKRHRLDRLLTGRYTSIPFMLLLLLLVFWITIYGAQIPSDLLSRVLFSLETPLADGLAALYCPPWLSRLLVYGMYRVLAFVVSVMLPPMAIFFPLFTLLEDFGYLPRVAFNLDHCFQRCRSCGKQALTMCMGFGCNAAGVVGCRIIHSPRERLIAILTNAFVPCNGRFPTIIALLTLFFSPVAGGFRSSFVTAAELTGVIVLGIGMTFLCSLLLSKTLLKGEPSFYSLELPPYRMPQVGQILVRSVLDRTLFVLGRSVLVAAPAGVLIWLLANCRVEGMPLLQWLSDGLGPLGKLLGMDGAILLAFLLGMPANEIVIPIMLMTYTGAGVLTGYDSLADLKPVLLQQGWTGKTALCVILFMLFHWPCTTTLLTVYKETKSLPYTLLSFVLPTAVGAVLCTVMQFFL